MCHMMKQNDPVLESVAMIAIADTAKRALSVYPYTNMFGDEGYYLGV